MVILLDILTTAALLFLVTAGLMVVFGVMKIVNFAHGSLLTVGAYVSLVTTQLHLSPWLSLPLAVAVGFTVGMAAERWIVRPLYRRPLDAILATWGLGIIIGQLIVLAFGREVQFAESPVDGTFRLFGIDYSAYRLLLVPLAILLAAALIGLLSGTRFGVSTRAVIMNEALATGLGIPAGRVRFIAFALGSSLAALAGVLITPLSSVDPGVGLPWLVSAFMLVMVAGESIGALLLTCVVFAAVQVVASRHASPVLGGLVIPVLAALTLRIRPQGFSRS
ncbi:branched-chain amino acid transport system permease protein [Roseateles sp. YR242]|uniref:branched-chain amino acid ABC transporter permease n=1 Tax=Roseateles sp. YR242 TaxID=1855305 RepID=UPI0008D56508|nr:branched-chain amino acid ABC transporter permease [Roseateles sp. YR242]SEK63510.1 branched-chain amino acid transport system permease protein [Roseateles sp. YR242]